MTGAARRDFEGAVCYLTPRRNWLRRPFVRDSFSFHQITRIGSRGTMEAGIVGLPNVGKSTLFNALTMSKAAQSANYPFCTIEPNEGVVSVPDGRLQRITKYIVPKKIVTPR